MFRCPTSLCRASVSTPQCHNCHVRVRPSLLAPECYLLQQLGQVIPFEIAVGHNGRVWIKAGTIRSEVAELITMPQFCLSRETIILREAILSSIGKTNEEIDILVCILAWIFVEKFSCLFLFGRLH